MESRGEEEEMMWKKLPNEPEKRRDGADFSSLASSIWRKTINSPLTLEDCRQDGFSAARALESSQEETYIWESITWNKRDHLVNYSSKTLHLKPCLSWSYHRSHCDNNFFCWRGAHLQLLVPPCVTAIPFYLRQSNERRKRCNNPPPLQSYPPFCHLSPPIKSDKVHYHILDPQRGARLRGPHHRQSSTDRC